VAALALRSITLQWLLEAALFAVANTEVRAPEGDHKSVCPLADYPQRSDDFLHALKRHQKVRQRNAITDQRIREAADLYRQHGGSLIEVGKHLHLGKTQTAKLVRLAKERDYIPQSRKDL